MEITINGEQRQLVGNPPAVGDDFPHFKVFDKDGNKVKLKELLGKVTLLRRVSRMLCKKGNFARMNWRF